MEPLLNLKDAAILLHTSVSTVRRRIKAKRLRAVYFGGQLRIEPDDLQNYRALLETEKCVRKKAVSVGSTVANDDHVLGTVQYGQQVGQR